VALDRIGTHPAQDGLVAVEGERRETQAKSPRGVGDAGDQSNGSWCSPTRTSSNTQAPSWRYGSMVKTASVVPDASGLIGKSGSVMTGLISPSIYCRVKWADTAV
jgi:hypothetical protein